MVYILARLSVAASTSLQVITEHHWLVHIAPASKVIVKGFDKHNMSFQIGFHGLYSGLSVATGTSLSRYFCNATGLFTLPLLQK
jgi:hypothetical protein